MLNPLLIGKNQHQELVFSAAAARRKDTVVEAMPKSAARSIGSQGGREIIRGVLESMLKR